jgi:excisionase family DNA binding protein
MEENITMSSAAEITAMTIEEAAPHLKIAPKTLRKWLREGMFPGVKVGRKWLVRVADVEHALTHGRRGDHAVWVPPEARLDLKSAPTTPTAPAPAPLHLVPPLNYDQRKAELVARLRSMQAQGLSLQAIANQLNREGVPTLSGKGTWKKGTVGNLLAEEVVSR